MVKKVIYKSTVVITILSDEPIGDVNLETIASEIETGGWSGELDFPKMNVPLKGKQAALAVIAQGSDPEFFGMDKDGNELEDYL